MDAVIAAGPVLEDDTATLFQLEVSYRSIALSKFLHLLWMFCNKMNVGDAARILSMKTNTVRSLYKTLRQCMAEDLHENGVIQKIDGQVHI